MSQYVFPLKPPGTGRTSNGTHWAYRHDNMSEKPESQAHVLRKRAAAAHRSDAKIWKAFLNMSHKRAMFYFQPSQQLV